MIEPTDFDPTEIEFTDVYENEGWFYFDAILPTGVHIQSGEFAHEVNARADLNYVQSSTEQIMQFLFDFQFDDYLPIDGELGR